MSVSNINSTSSSLDFQSVVQTAKESTKVSEPVANADSAQGEIQDVVEISSNEKTNSKSSVSSKYNSEAVQKAIQESNEKTAQFKSLIEKLFKQQSKTIIDATWDELVKTGKLGDTLKTIEVDEETKLKAQADIAEDGYWGVKQTSERILSFAKALANNDPSKADVLLEGFKKGFAAAEDAFGGEGKLPQISYDTYDAVIKGFDEWKNETETIADTTNEQIVAQASSGLLSE